MYAALCFKGVEDICSDEVESLVGGNVESREGIVLFEKKFEKICYNSYTVNRVIELIDSFTFKEVGKIHERIKNLKLDILEGKKFAVKTEYVDGELKIDRYSSQIAKEFYDLHPGNFRYKNPDVLLIVYICNGRCYIGVDKAFDLSKRSYKVTTYGRDLKGTIAASLVKMSGLVLGKKFLDAFCLNGTVCIEAALIVNGKSPWFFDKDEFKFDVKDFKEGSENVYATGYQRRFVEAARRNAAVAGVDERIIFYEEAIYEMGNELQDVDCVVANLPRMTKINKNGIGKLYSAFLEQISKMLSSTGKCVAVSTNISGFKEQLKDFNIIEEREIVHGHETLFVVVFSK